VWAGAGPCRATAPVGPGESVTVEIDFATQLPRVVARTAVPPWAPGHVVVEPTAELASLFDAEPDLLGELLEAARRVARDVIGAHGACRIHIDTTANPLRVHVYAHEPV